MPPPQSAICQCISASVLFLHSTHNCASRPPQPCRKQQKTEKQKRTGWNRCSPDTTWDKGARGNESSPPSVETLWMLHLLQASLSAHHCKTSSPLCHIPELREVQQSHLGRLPELQRGYLVRPASLSRKSTSLFHCLLP